MKKQKVFDINGIEWLVWIDDAGQPRMELAIEYVLPPDFFCYKTV